MEENKDLPFIAKMKDLPGKPSVLWYKKSKQKESRTEGNKGTFLVPPKAFDSQCKYINCRMIHMNYGCIWHLIIHIFVPPEPSLVKDLQQ